MLQSLTHEEQPREEAVPHHKAECFQIRPGHSDTPVLASNVPQTEDLPASLASPWGLLLHQLLTAPSSGPSLLAAPSLSSGFLSHPATPDPPSLPQLILAAISQGLKMYSKDQKHY